LVKVESHTAGRRSRSKKAETRDRIVHSAAAEFRRNGYAATGIDRVMAGAGLTAGGFYAHFPSKDDLLAEVFDVSAREALRERATRPDGAPGSVEVFIDRYLSAEHREELAGGCPFAALGAEAAHVDKARSAAGQSLAEAIVMLTGRNDSAAAPEAILALCVGGLVLARLAATIEESDALLNTCREAAHTLMKPTA
jgi:TetR/AcrR family transcriptional regulator, transcriptional repressor for nem operon